MKIILTVLCMFVIAFTLQAQNEKLRVAVFDPTSSGTSIDEGTKVAVREIISSTFVNTGKYNIVERSLLQQVMKEQAFSNSDVVDESQATELGRLAGANKVVLSVVTLVGGRNMLSVKTIDVKTATVDKQKTRVVSSNDLLDAVESLTLDMLGEKLSTTSVSGSSKSNIKLGKTSGALGSGIGALFGKKDKDDSETQKQSKEKPISKQDQKKIEAEEQAERDRQIALTAANSYDMANSVSNIILQTISKQEGKKATRYTTDVERFDKIKKKEDILKYINTITSDVGGIPPENDDITFYCKKEQVKDKDEVVLLLFLDGRCIGIGTKIKGLLSKMPNLQSSRGTHNISIWNGEEEILDTPVNFDFKSNYIFEWNKNKVALTN